MTQAHVTNGGGQSHSETKVSAVSRSSAPWLAEGISKATYYRRRQSNRPEVPQLNGNGNTEPELKTEQPQFKSEPMPDLNSAPPKSEPQENEATRRLKQQLEDLELAGAINNGLPLSRDMRLRLFRRHGLTHDEELFLRQHPELIDHADLCAYCSELAAQQCQKGTAEHREKTLELFHEASARLQEQARQNVAAQQSPAEPTPASDNQPEPTAMPSIPPPPPGLLDVPAPRQQRSGRSAAIVSAPVSRDTPGTRAYDAERDPRRMTLTAQEAEAARISGVSPAEYARQKLKMLEMKQRGEIQG